MSAAQAFVELLEQAAAAGEIDRSLDLDAVSVMRGWTKDERVMIACCNDGTRLVVF